MTYDTINDAVTRAGGAGALLMGRYRIVRPLGQGGMGSVWLAEDTHLDNKLFAIKMLPSILANNKRAYAQLKKEALVAMKLVHPNIVQIRAFEENNGNPFLVMDYIDGETLDDYLADYNSRVEHVERVDGNGGRAGAPRTPQGGISEADVLRILRPIAAALDYAHTKGVVHRDVKPGNVMIAKDGTPYILDFGIAREIQETMTRVTGKLSSGTLLYMSPEQLMGEKPTPAQDIYSFAAMAYECLKGEPPFTHGQIEFQIMNKPPEPLPGGPSCCSSVAIMAGLAKKPEVRPSSCTDVLSVHEQPVVPVLETLPLRPQMTDGSGDVEDKTLPPRPRTYTQQQKSAHQTIERVTDHTDHEQNDLHPRGRRMSLIKTASVVIVTSLLALGAIGCTLYYLTGGISATAALFFFLVYFDIFAVIILCVGRKIIAVIKAVVGASLVSLCIALVVTIPLMKWLHVMACWVFVALYDILCIWLLHKKLD